MLKKQQLNMHKNCLNRNLPNANMLIMKKWNIYVNNLRTCKKKLKFLKMKKCHLKHLLLNLKKLLF